MHKFKAATKKKMPYWHELHNHADCQDTNSFSRCMPSLPYCHPNQPASPSTYHETHCPSVAVICEGKIRIEVLAGTERKVSHTAAQQQGGNIFLY